MTGRHSSQRDSLSVWLSWPTVRVFYSLWSAPTVWYSPISLPPPPIVTPPPPPFPQGSFLRKRPVPLPLLPSPSSCRDLTFVRAELRQEYSLPLSKIPPAPEPGLHGFFSHVDQAPVRYSEDPSSPSPAPLLRTLCFPPRVQHPLYSL